MWGHNPKLREVGQERDVLGFRGQCKSTDGGASTSPTLILDSVNSLTFFLRCKYLNSSLS